MLYFVSGLACLPLNEHIARMSHHISPSVTVMTFIFVAIIIILQEFHTGFFFGGGGGGGGVGEGNEGLHERGMARVSYRIFFWGGGGGWERETRVCMTLQIKSLNRIQ